eukprot:CAMPEP_0194449714 /NCGR_PEP_ID=MMETSP0176-20130528/130307_1 /TAXON_ID=216777 /ORGANISM="Proboscia alata, Strain PI-D3" /LENGTH=42 /DNA_ID= /DNA_START= /DNA_END= /DNA_ORIENTATION=
MAKKLLYPIKKDNKEYCNNNEEIRVYKKEKKKHDDNDGEIKV